MEGKCLAIDIALSYEGMEILLKLLANNIHLISVVNTQSKKANFYNYCLQINTNEPTIAVLYTPGHFSTILIHRTSKQKFIVYSFDSQGSGAKYSINNFLEYDSINDDGTKSHEKDVTFEIITPPFVRQKSNEPLCYAFAIKDALILNQCLEQKAPTKDIHSEFFSSHSRYAVRDIALLLYEALILKSYQLPYEHLKDKFLLNEDDSLETESRLTSNGPF